MKIAVFHFLPDGGAKITLLEQLRILKKRHQIDLYTFISNENNIDIKTYCRKTYLYPYNAIPLKRKRGFNRVFEDFNSFTFLRKIHRGIAKDIDNGKYDIAFIHASRLTQAPYVLRYLKTPSLYFCQEPLRMVYEYGLRMQDKVNYFKKAYEILNRVIRKKIDKENAIAADKIIANSDYTRHNILLAYGENASTCHLGVDATKFSPKKNEKRKWILYVGSKTWIDGYHLLKKSFKYLSKSARSKIKIVDTTRVDDLPKDAKGMRDMYSQSIATVCPAVLEPFGMVALESMACETPVIAVNEGGYRETVINSKTGFLIKRNPKILAEKINLLLKNNKLRIKLGKNARQQVVDDWSWEKCVEKLEKEFNTTKKK